MSKSKLLVAEEQLRKVFKTKKVKYEDVEVQLDPNLMTASWPHWSTGAIAIDYLIGGKPNQFGIPPCPGLPKGKVINLYGLEASGKSTLALTMAAQINKEGGEVCYIDCEHEVDLRYAKKIGVQVENKGLFRLFQPETLEQALTIALAAISSGVELVVWDSVGAAVPEAEHIKSEKEMEATAKVGGLAKKWSEKLPILKARASKTKSIFLGISQMRQNISTFGHGDKYTVQGGMTWKYFSALRIRLSQIGKDKADVVSALDNRAEKAVIGTIVKAKLDKCKVSDQQNAEVTFYIRFGQGIDNLRTILETAIVHKIIKKGGAWYTWVSPNGEEVKQQGMEKFWKYMSTHEEPRRILEEQVLKKIFTYKSEDDDIEEVFDEDEEVEENLEEEISLEDELKDLLG